MKIMCGGRPGLSTLHGDNMNSGDYSTFLEDHLSKLEPLSREVNLAYWRASISGREQDFTHYAELQVRLQYLHSDKNAFENLAKWKSEDWISDPVAKRQLELLYNDFLRNQIDPKLNENIIKLACKIENQFSVYRAELDGQLVTSNDILRILKNTSDCEIRRKAWEAGKKVGVLVHDDLITLVKLRNEAARSLGYENFYVMSLVLAEQSEKDIVALFDEVETRTREPFTSAKQEIDGILSERYSISTQEIKPWHFEDLFFQEVPRIDGVNLDEYYENHDILDIVTGFFAGIGLQVEDILANSDLFEKPGKLQHAFCTDIDRKGDIRILANIKNDENWMSTMLHELGHAVYTKCIDPSLPYLLREETHIFTTEAIAMLFGRLSKNAGWIQQVTGLTDGERDSISEALTKNSRLSQVVFTRWCQVMFHFERELYRNPERDLNALWWKLAQGYQQMTPPSDMTGQDWAAKIHIATAPAYYHNYLLGECLASQLEYHISDAISGNRPFFDWPELGGYLKYKIFRTGSLLRWDHLIEKATGEKLTPRYFVQQFAG